MLTNYQLNIILASVFYILGMKADGLEALAYVFIALYFWTYRSDVPTTKE